MKRLLAAALFMACAVGLTSQAHALVWQDVAFYNSQANRIGKTEVDTTYASGDAIRSDTTVAVSTAGWGLNQDQRAGTAVDSTTFFVAHWTLVPSSITSAVDSIYVTTQVSMDGANWVTATPTSIYADNTLSNTPRVGMIFLDSAAIPNQFGWAGKVARAATGWVHNVMNGSTAPLTKEIFGYKFIRWIVGSTNDGAFKLSVGTFPEGE